MVRTFFKRLLNVSFGLFIILLAIVAISSPNFLWIIALVLSISFIVSGVGGIVDSLQEQVKLLRLISLIIEIFTLILGILLFIAAIFDIFVFVSALLLVLGMAILLGVTGAMRIISAITLKMDAKWFRVVNFVMGGGFILLGTIILYEPIIGIILLEIYVIISLFLNGAIRIMLGLFGVYEVNE